MAADDAAVVVTLRANLKDYEAALKTAVRQTERAAQAAEKAVSGIGKTARPGNVIAVDFQKSAAQIANDARVMQFQLNDVFSGIASGQGIRALQVQLGQIAQIMSGGGLAAGARTLGTALVGMINPINLAVVAFGLAATAAADYFSSSEDGAKEAAKAFDEALQAINELRRVQGLKALEPPTDALAKLEAQRNAIAKIAEMSRLAAKSIGDMGDAIRTQQALEALSRPARSFGGIVRDAGQADTLNAINKALEELQSSIEKGTPDFVTFLKTMEQFEGLENLPPVLKKLVTQIIGMAIEGANAQRNLDELNKTIDGSAKSAEHAAEAAKKFAEGLAEMGKIAAAQISDVQKLLDLYRQTVQSAQTMGEVLAANQAFQQGQQRIDISNAKDAIELIKKFEGFQPKAKFDVNAFRAGFGSDTFVDEMGKVQKVTADTVVTVDQATRDLERRVVEFQQTIVQQIGPELWKSFDEKQQAALTSIAYNYGRLPASIVKAIQAGDRGQVAKAIQALGTDNAGVNRGRRQQEAELFAGGSLREQKQSYDELVQSINAKIDAQTRENAINADAAKSTDDRTAALAREKAAQEAATVAKQLDAATIEQYGSITDAQRDKNRQLAEQYAATGLKAEELSLRNQRLAESQRTAAAEADKLSEAQKRARQALVDTLASMATSAITGFVQDLRNGVSAAEALYNAISRIADQLLQMALQAAFKQIFGALLGGVGGGMPMFASGGYTGDVSTRAPAGVVHGQEFVVNAQATRRHRDLLEAINRGTPGYATGGFVLPRVGRMFGPAGSQPMVASVPDVHTRTTVVNTFDAGSFLSEALSKPAGVNVILNAVRAQPGAFRNALQG